ncbi:MAG: PEP-CTERM sorting domain-containing protein, partial [Planctomycetota bacterium]
TGQMRIGSSLSSPIGEVKGRLLIEGGGTARSRETILDREGALSLDDNAFFLGEMIIVNPGGVTDLQGGTLAAESVIGDLVNHAGTVAPQDFAGPELFAMSVSGSYTQGSAATLDLQLGASAHDALQITGQADLAGTLNVTLANLFTPTLGDTFDLLDFGSIVGGFDAINLPTLGDPGLTWDTSDLLTTGILAVATATIPGDLDLDGDVDLADIDLLLDNLTDPAFDLTDDATTDYDDVEELLINILDTSPGDANLDGQVSTPDLAILAGSFDQSFSSWADGDFTGDNFVDTADLAVLAGYFGQGTTSLTNANTTPLVPEPASLALLALGGLLTLQRRHPS